MIRVPEDNLEDARITRSSLVALLLRRMLFGVVKIVLVPSELNNRNKHACSNKLIYPMVIIWGSEEKNNYKGAVLLHVFMLIFLNLACCKANLKSLTAC